MDAQQFAAEFGHIADTPGGVARLRELVLRLAVSGCLTNQLENEDAFSFLNEIASHQEKLGKAGEIRINKKIREGGFPGVWQIPTNWQWCRFGELCSFSAGRTPSRKESKYWNTSEYQWFSIADLQHRQIVSVSRESVSETARHEIFKSPPAPAGSLLMSFKLTIGKLCLLGVDAYHNEAIIRIEPFSDVLKGYFFKCLNGFDLTAGNKAAIKGNTLNQDSISNIFIALPPKSEIPRIIAKVDELMILCDKLEEQQQARRKLQNALRQSILQSVASASNPLKLQSSWARLSENFGQLFSAPEDVDEFIAELKNMAVRGLLDLESVTPSETESIKSSCDDLRADYIKTGLMRRQKAVCIADSGVTYPKHWSVVPFDDVAVVIGGVTKGRNLRDRETLTCPYLSVANVQQGFFKLQELKSIQIAVDELEKYLVRQGDLLITEGGDWDKVGRTAIWRDNIERCLHQNHVFKARIPSEFLMSEWVELVFNSSVGRDYFARASKQTTNLASINMTQLRSFPLPIPSKDEQRAILGKLECLTKSALLWRQKLQKKQSIATKLAGAVFASLTGFTSQQEKDEPMKAPQTKLIAPVRLGTPPDIKAQAPLATILARHKGEMPAKDLWLRFSGEIDAFYAQMKLEVANGWILEPTEAEMREEQTDKVNY